MSMDTKKEIKYDDLIKRPSANAAAIGRRPPVYINYTQEGRLKNVPAAVMEKSMQAAGMEDKDGNEI